ncbi:peptidoglycan-binding protein [Pendulispora brunnea]|uniref:Peptidoglycan-binding protein n=1 Tax=Pendulispora brunnea TaxID=2905690 RepID=A0ABZ2KIC6_9BACT
MDLSSLNPLARVTNLLPGGGESAHDDQFKLAAGTFRRNELRVAEFNGTERINDLYLYPVLVVTDKPFGALVALKGLDACLSIGGVDGHDARAIQGIVAHVETRGAVPGDEGKGRRLAELLIAPRLWLLTERTTNRVFYQKTPKEIVQQVLASIGIKAEHCCWHIKEDRYPRLPIVIQRNETDYEFFCRVLSEAGILFFFDHASDSLLSGASAVAGEAAAIADAIGGAVADVANEVGKATKTLTILTFTDNARHLPAVQDMAALNEAATSAIKSGIGALAGAIVGGDAARDVEEAVDDVVESMPDSIVYDASGVSSEKERFWDFRVKASIGPKRLHIIERDIHAGKNWVGAVETKSVTAALHAGVGLHMGKGGPSLKARGSFDFDVDAPNLPPEILRKHLYQVNPTLRFYQDQRERMEMELQRERVHSVIASGTGNCRRLGAGYRFMLEKYSYDELDREYTTVFFECKGQAHTDPFSGETQYAYSNSIVCVPAHVIPRPARLRGPILGDDVATVATQEGERVTSLLDADEQGHVKLVFPWELAADEVTPRGALAYGAEQSDAARIPVTQALAGDNFGTRNIPRDGAHVVAGFFNGQSGRPLVRGCLFDETNRMPFRGDPRHYQKIGIFSQTIPYDGGASEISIDDQRGAELVNVHSQRDIDVHARHEFRARIDANAVAYVAGPVNVEVEGAFLTQIAGTERRMVLESRVDHVKDTISTTCGSSEFTVTRDMSVKAGGQYELQAAGESKVAHERSRTTTIGEDDVTSIGRNEIVTVLGESNKHVSGQCRVAGKKLLLEAEESIRISVKGSSIELRPDGIYLSGDTVKCVSKKLELHAEGAGVRLDNLVEVMSSDIVLQGAGARLKLAEAAQLTGRKIQIGKGDGATVGAQKLKDATVKKAPLICLDEDRQPLASRRYQLEIGGQLLEGMTDAHGRVMVPMVDDTTTSSCTVWKGDFPDGERVIYPLTRGPIESADSVLGAQQCLRNLGWYSGPLSGAMNSTMLDTLLCFQDHHDLEVTGELDSSTSAKITELHSPT